MTIQMGATYTFYKNGEQVAKSRNLLTNGFFTRMLTYGGGDPQIGHYCACFVGTGTTEPTEADVGMEANVATVNRDINKMDRALGSMSITPAYGMQYTSGGKYWGMYNWGKMFTAGMFSGQAITEVGARFSHVDSTNTQSSTTIDSHALIKDANGVVTPIVLTATDTLYVHVRFSYSVPYDEKSTMMLGGVPYTARYSANDYDATSVVPWSIFYRSKTFDNQAFLQVPEIKANANSTSLDYTSIYTSAQAIPNPNTATHPHSTDTSAGIAAVTPNIAARTLSITYSFGLTSGEAAGVRQIQMGGEGSANKSFFSVNFDEPVTGWVAGTNSITITHHFAQLSGYGDKPTLEVSMHPSLVTETVANGVATTIAKPRLIVK